MDKKRIAFFDFCDTFIDHQTRFPFINYVYNQEHTFAGSIVFQLRNILKRLHLLPPQLGVRLQVRMLKGVEETHLQRYATDYAQTLHNSINTEVLEAIKNHCADGDDVYIVSAGYTVYIASFVEQLHLPIKVIGSDFEVRDGKLTGRMKGKNCYGKHKVTKIREAIDLRQFDLSVSSTYSDCMSDKPLFELTQNRYFVYYKNESLQSSIPKGYTLFPIE